MPQCEPEFFAWLITLDCSEVIVSVMREANRPALPAKRFLPSASCQALPAKRFLPSASCQALPPAKRFLPSATRPAQRFPPAAQRYPPSATRPAQRYPPSSALPSPAVPSPALPAQQPSPALPAQQRPAQQRPAQQRFPPAALNIPSWLVHRSKNKYTKYLFQFDSGIFSNSITQNQHESNMNPNYYLSSPDENEY